MGPLGHRGPDLLTPLCSVWIRGLSSHPRIGTPHPCTEVQQAPAQRTCAHACQPELRLQGRPHAQLLPTYLHAKAPNALRHSTRQAPEDHLGSHMDKGCPQAQGAAPSIFPASMHRADSHNQSCAQRCSQPYACHPSQIGPLQEASALCVNVHVSMHVHVSMLVCARAQMHLCVCPSVQSVLQEC